MSGKRWEWRWLRSGKAYRIKARMWGNLCQREVRKKAEWVMKHEGH